MKRKMIGTFLTLLLISVHVNAWDITWVDHNGQPVPYLIAYPMEYEGTLDEPILIIREIDNRLDVYIDWGGYSIDASAGELSYSIDYTVDLWPFTPSTSLEAAFLLNSESFIEKMQAATTNILAFVVVTRGGADMAAIFSLNGFNDAYRELIIASRRAKD